MPAADGVGHAVADRAGGVGIDGEECAAAGADPAELGLVDVGRTRGAGIEERPRGGQIGVGQPGDGAGVLVAEGGDIAHIDEAVEHVAVVFQQIELADGAGEVVAGGGGGIGHDGGPWGWG